MSAITATDLRSTQIEIATPKCEFGIGDVIMTPESPKLIHGVMVKRFDVFPDDRGYFLEVARAGQGLLSEFDPRQTQTSAAMSYVGCIKAFHFHRKQFDAWTAVMGQLQVALVDLRPESPTFGRKNTMYIGELRPWQVLIPPGVGHGYKVTGRGPALLVYATSRFYDPQDEGRIKHNDSQIAYDWEMQYK